MSSQSFDQAIDAPLSGGLFQGRVEVVLSDAEAELRDFLGPDLAEVLAESDVSTEAIETLNRVLQAPRPYILGGKTKQFLELEALTKSLPTPKTRYGILALTETIENPTNDYQTIIIRRDTIKFLGDNPKVRSSFEAAVKSLDELDQNLKNFTGWGLTFDQIKGLSDSAAAAASAVNRLPDVSNCGTPLLQGIKEELTSFIQSEKFIDLLEPIGVAKGEFLHYSKYSKTRRAGLRLLDSEGAFKMATEPWRRWIYLPGTVAAVGIVGALVDAYSNPNHFMPLNVVLAFSGLVASVSTFVIGDSFSSKKYSKIKNLFKETFFGVDTGDQIKKAAKVYQTIGLLDELCSQSKSKGKFLELVDEDRHSLHLTEAKNPQLHYTGRKPRPIDINIEGGVPIGITGPQFCGKTAAMKTALQIQLLAQGGFKVPVKSGSACIADFIVMDAFEVATLKEGGSSAKNSLRMIRRVLESVGPRTILFLDEIGQGTSDEEAAPVIKRYIPFLRKLGVSALIVFQDRKVAQELSDEGLIDARHVREENGKPTYLLHPGVSTQHNYAVLADLEGLSAEELEELAERKLEDWRKR